jgi:hypothetical protein
LVGGTTPLAAAANTFTSHSFGNRQLTLDEK